MPGPITQLLTLPDLEPVPDPPARAPRRRLPVSGTLLAWSVGIPTVWTAGMILLAVAVRF